MLLSTFNSTLYSCFKDNKSNFEIAYKYILCKYVSMSKKHSKIQLIAFIFKCMPKCTSLYIWVHFAFKAYPICPLLLCIDLVSQSIRS